MLAAHDITTEWLTETFRSLDVYGNVTANGSRVLGTKETTSSQLTFIEVDWSHGNGSRKLPSRLCHKVASGRALTDREARIYHDVAKTATYDFSPSSFHFSWSANGESYSLLLEDMSSSHRRLNPNLPPTMREADEMIKGLARFHAEWWDHKNLNNLATTPSDFDLDRAQAFAESHFPKVADFLDDRLSPEDSARIGNLISDYGYSAKNRFREGCITMLHGDTHNANFLLPRHGADVSYPLLIDWQTPYWYWEVGPGLFDVAYLIIRFWPARYSRLLEPRLLDRYVTAIQESGIEYDLERAWVDYRLGVVHCLLLAIDVAFRSREDLWFPQFDRVLSAMNELDCRPMNSH